MHKLHYRPGKTPINGVRTRMWWRLSTTGFFVPHGARICPKPLHAVPAKDVGHASKDLASILAEAFAAIDGPVWATAADIQSFVRAKIGYSIPSMCAGKILRRMGFENETRQVPHYKMARVWGRGVQGRPLSGAPRATLVCGEFYSERNLQDEGRKASVLRRRDRRNAERAAYELLNEMSKTHIMEQTA
ncbi:MAG: hypothetical protein HXX10_07355 [Rhodoplanes sp.]|uniref:hypothetical protein n=1 Tax=Rhodoplanes sp. TaxID=1968906 RepID=UPI001790AA76|nr:hypothetical protein [Rhodoplanes sp.]NVO13836.1 hypothetical protein [Rhodoplanes sp.]